MKCLNKLLLSITLFSCCYVFQSKADDAALWADKDRIENQIDAREMVLKREGKTLVERLRDNNLQSLREELRKIDQKLDVEDEESDW